MGIEDRDWYREQHKKQYESLTKPIDQAITKEIKNNLVKLENYGKKEKFKAKKRTTFKELILKLTPIALFIAAIFMLIKR